MNRAATDRAASTRADIIDFLAVAQATRPMPPTVREIAAAVGIRSSNTITKHLARLEAWGWVRHEPGRKRTLRLTPLGLSQAQIYWPVDRQCEQGKEAVA